MHPSAIGFMKEAGLRELAGRAITGIGRAVGSSKLESRGFRMQHGSGSMVKRPARLKPRSKPKMELVVPHDVGAEQAAVMKGTSKAKQRYVTPHGYRRGS